MTATLLIGEPPHSGRLARFAVAEPIEQRGQDRRHLGLEAVRRIDHQQAAAVQPRRIDRLAQAKFGGDDVADAALLQGGEELRAPGRDA